MFVRASHRRDQFIRQALYEKYRIIYLEGNFDKSWGMAYSGNDPSLPLDFPSSPRAAIDQVLFLNKLNYEPIKLIIDHPGGSIAAFFNLHDVIMAAESPIYTVGMGLVGSAAVSVLVAGKKRFIFANSQTMVHMSTGRAAGDEEQIEKQKQKFLKTQGRYVNVLSQHTGKSPEEIKEAMKKETWMNAEETKAFGLVDQIIEKLSDIDL